MVFLSDLITGNASADLQLRRYIAPYKLLAYTFTEADKLLDYYIRRHYKTNLQNICRELINHCVWSIADGKIKATFIEMEQKNWATFITYGNLKVPGSKILFKLFA